MQSTNENTDSRFAGMLIAVTHLGSRVTLILITLTTSQVHLSWVNVMTSCS